MTDTKNQKKKEGFKPVSPKTDFVKLENDLLEKWYKEGIVEKYLHKNDSSEDKFSFLDGPITANNPMGVHHAWGRTYKDFWQRYWNMQGKKERFQNGFDEQGLWVEVEVEKELGLKSKKDIENLIPGDKFKSLEKFINLCKERVAKFSKIQTEQSKRLGYFMDWDNSYHTSSPQNNYAIWNFLKTVHEKGWLYKGRDSVPWCPRCGTAISQHEILTEEYKEITHRTIIFKLKIKDRDNEYFLAWTTTPWTVPGNIALAVDAKETYWKLKSSNGETVIIIDPTKKEKEGESFVRKQKLAEGLEKVGEIKGKDLVGLEYEAPFDFLPKVKKDLGNYTHKVVASDSLILPINTKEGTGIVHVATGAGAEDFQLGKKEKLPVIEEIDEEGIFIDGFNFLTGLNVKEASKKVLSYLEEKNLAYKIIDYTHRYPTCWRCKTELVWRVVFEWYIAMDKVQKTEDRGRKTDSRGQKTEDGTYREQMVEVAKKIKWMPEWGLERELDWLKNMHDWLISKKRYWGLALPIWECQKCGNFEVIGSEKELKEKAAEGFDKFEGNTPHRPWIDLVKIKCSKCSSVISRIHDVGNPWLDAGIVSISTMQEDWFPAHFIVESFPGQFKNWFYSLIAMSTALKNTNPTERILGFGSVKDEKGEEMHKSKGNAIEFNEAANKIGVDVMRWLYLRTNPEHNVNFGYHVTDEVRRFFHLRLWNVYAFFVTYANADNWKPKGQDKVQNVLDEWIISRMNGSINNIKAAIERYDAAEAAWLAEIFVINDLSNWYVRRIRDRVGPSVPDSKDKDSAYQALYTVLVEYSKVLASFIPFISDEVYTNLTGEESVHLIDFPFHNVSLSKNELEKEMDFAMELSSIIHGARKSESIKVRIPIRKLSYKGQIKLSEEVKKIVEEEVNVYELAYLGKTDQVEVKGDMSVKNQDQEAGRAREIIRKIQEERKKLGTRLDEKVDVVLEDYPKEFEEEIKRKALISSLEKGEFEVKRQSL